MRTRVLNRHLWNIADTPLVLHEWRPKTAHNAPVLSSLPLWVDFSSVPDHLYSEKGLGFLASFIGKGIKLHPNTEARVLVEVNLEKPLPQILQLSDPSDGQSYEVNVSIPWLLPRCSSCQKWGHSALDCNVSVKQVDDAVGPSEQPDLTPPVSAVDAVEENQKDTVGGSTSVQEGNASGDSWTIVSNRSPKYSTRQPSEEAKQITPPATTTNGPSSPSRFSILAELLEEGECVGKERN